MFSYVVTLPVLTKDKARVYVSRLNETHVHLFNITDLIIRVTKLADIRSRYDYCLYDYYVVDFKSITMLQISQFNPVLCKKFITILEVNEKKKKNKNLYQEWRYKTHRLCKEVCK